MTTRARLAAVSVVAALLCVAACRGGTTKERAAAPEAPAAPGIPADAFSEAGESESAPLEHTPVTLYFPSATGDGLAREPREIVATPRPEDQAKQILSDLIEGPLTEAALPALPPGTRLRHVYVLDDGTAYADFSTELRAGSNGGSADEILAVYAIVDSLALNVPGIVRVGILVDGQPCETLGGHVDLRRPLRADSTLIEQPPEAVPSGTEPPPDTPAPASRDQQPIEA